MNVSNGGADGCDGCVNAVDDAGGGGGNAVVVAVVEAFPPPPPPAEFALRERFWRAHIHRIFVKKRHENLVEQPTRIRCTSTRMNRQHYMRLDAYYLYPTDYVFF